jgi:zinc/manganese transport system permease protein
METLLELKWMLLPFLACLVLSINHVYLGIHVIARKVIFVDLALAQIAALGATYALVLGYDPNTDPLAVMMFSLAFTFAGAGLFALARMRKEKVPQEAFIGIIYAAASAEAILILSKSASGGEELRHMLVGDVLLVSMPAIINMALLYGSIGLFHLIFRRKFLAISFDPENAEASGMNIRFWDILFYMSFGVVITKSVAIVGVLLVFSYLVVPAVIAQMWCESVRRRLLVGWFVAILASTGGILWSFYKDYPTGPAVVVMLGIFLIASSVAYYLRHSEMRLRAMAHVAAILVFFGIFFSGLSLFRKPDHDVLGSQVDPIAMFLEDINSNDEAKQLHVIEHLGSLKDPRIMPAVMNMILTTRSEQVVEAAAEYLAHQRDPKAIPALQQLAAGRYDAPLKVAIARAQLASGDKDGYGTLIAVLKADGEDFARKQAIDLLTTSSGKDFGYRAEIPVAENAAALRQIDEWWARDKQKSK